MELTNKTVQKVQHKKDEKKPGLWEQLVLALIRPPRQKYNPQQLGNVFNDKGALTYYVRQAAFTKMEYSIKHDKQDIELTLLSPSTTADKVILYLHGNSSSRMESLHLLEYLPGGFALASFDFLGCGLTSEQYISLGVRQAEQIKSVVQFLSAKNYEVVLWGRSMGAVSALRYGKCNIIVADSPFVSL